MTITIDVDTIRQSNEVIQGLLARREWALEHNQTSQVEAIDELLVQFVGTAAGKVLLGDVDLSFETAQCEVCFNPVRATDLADTRGARQGALEPVFACSDCREEDDGDD